MSWKHQGRSAWGAGAAVALLAVFALAAGGCCCGTPCCGAPCCGCCCYPAMQPGPTPPADDNIPRALPAGHFTQIIIKNNLPTKEVLRTSTYDFNYDTDNAMPWCNAPVTASGTKPFPMDVGPMQMMPFNPMPPNQWACSGGGGYSLRINLVLSGNITRTVTCNTPGFTTATIEINPPEMNPMVTLTCN